MLIKGLWIAYLPLHLLLSLLIHQDNVDLAYPAWFIFCSDASQAVLFIGILLHVFLRRSEPVAPYWRWIFPLLILDLLAGFAMDGVVLANEGLLADGTTWLTLMIALVLVFPAYYASFRLAAYRLPR